MYGNRKGESGPIPYRTGRLFVVDSEWYFTTREELNHGPFPTREIAEQESQTYIQVCLQIENKFDQVGLPTQSSQTKRA